MKKRAFTKLLAVIMMFSLLLSSVVLTGATNVEEVYRDGAIFIVTHYNPKYPTDGVTEEKKNNNHVMATGELCEAIENITYAEILMFDINTLYVGLPYDSVELVKALDTVQKVEKVEDKISQYSPEEKLTPQLSEVIKNSASDETIELGIYLCYNTLVYYGFKQDDFSDVQDYIEAQRAKQINHFTSKNQEIFDEICEKADAELIYNAKLRNYITVKTTISEIEKIALVSRVMGIEEIISEDPSEPLCTEPATESSTEKVFKYEEKFKDYSRLERYDPNTHQNGIFGTYRDYDELYEHYDETTGEVCWVLITAQCDLINPWDVLKTKRIGDRVISWWTYGAAFLPYNLGIYDVKEDKFKDISIVTPDDYEGLVQAVEDLKLGYEIGDTDLDGEVTVLDATSIQMYVAELLESDNREIQLTIGVSDMDGDGELSILDATAIQSKIAKINS